MAVSDQVTRLGNEIVTQENLIEQISAVLDGKAGGSETSQINVSVLKANGDEYSDTVVSMYDADHDRLCVVLNTWAYEVSSVENATLLCEFGVENVIGDSDAYLDMCMFFKDILGDVTIYIQTTHDGQ